MNVKNLLAIVALVAPMGAQAAVSRVVPVTGGTNVGAPIVVPGFKAGLTGVQTTPILTPSLKPTLVVAPKAPAVGIVAAQQAFATLSETPALQTIADQSQASIAQHPAALNEVYEKGIGAGNGVPTLTVGSIGTGSNGLAKSTGRSVTTQSSIANAAISLDNAAGSGVVWTGIKRLWDITVGKFLRWVSGAEKKNAKALAARIIAELDETLPKLNAAAAEIGKTVHLLKLQIDRDTKEASRLDALINKALEMGKEAEAGALLKQKQPIDASLAATQEQYESAKKAQAVGLQKVKDFYFERQATLNEIQGMLTRDELNNMQRRMNELNGQFKIGDIKSKVDKLKQIVDENEAEVKGQQDVIDNDGSNAVKEIEDALKNDSVKDELERRKAEIAKKKEGK